MRRSILAFTVLLGSLRLFGTQDMLDATGWSALAARLGPGEMPTGRDIPVLQVEVASQGTFAPAVSTAAFSGKTFSFSSWALSAKNPSSHATTVAGIWYGNTSGIAREVSTIRVAEAWCYATESARLGARAAPLPATWRVENHSWIAESSRATELLRRLDYRAVRDNVLIVAGLNNGATTQVPALAAHLYNGLVVGVSSGAHSRGGTRIDGAGRSKPDLVAPAPNTSAAAPLVSGAACLLLSEVAVRPAFEAAAQIEVVKAILLAGTSRSAWTSWIHSSDHPLDAVFGAGELNIERSHAILLGGPGQPASRALHPARGWCSGRTTAQETTLLLDLPGGPGAEFVAALTWPREVSPSEDFAVWDTHLPDLDLELWSVEPAALVAESRGKLDNVELIVARDLRPGRYVLVIASQTKDTKYGLAWYTDADAPLAPPAAPTGIVLLQ